jgi:hypothetical protein
MDRNVGAAARLSQRDREELAILALARSEFVYAQKHKARCALDDAFIFAATDDTVQFQIRVAHRLAGVGQLANLSFDTLTVG